MHMARFDLLDVVDMLHARAPATVRSHTADGRTPLLLACSLGHEAMVSRLISLGAIQQMLPGKSCPLPAAAAALQGWVGVIRLLDEGEDATPRSVRRRLLPPRQSPPAAARGGRSGDAVALGQLRHGWQEMLHYGASHCSPSVGSVLLEAGADEAIRDAWGVFPRDVIGVDLQQEQLPMDRGKQIAILRMLEQGPAYRARSWAWPTDEAEDADGSGDGGAVLSVAPSLPRLPVGMRIFRPKSDTKFFASVVGRYCEKD